MGSIGQRRVPAVLAWGSVAAVMIVPVAIAVFSPYLASRNMPYIVGGFAGIVGLSLLLLQPLLPAGYLAGSEGPVGRRWHRWLGVAIIVAVALHVGRLYLASPPDTIDALLLDRNLDTSEFAGNRSGCAIGIINDIRTSTSRAAQFRSAKSVARSKLVHASAAEAPVHEVVTSQLQQHDVALLATGAPERLARLPRLGPAADTWARTNA